MGYNLLQWGKFTSHSGLELPFKLECDALTDKDIECCAEIIASKITFGHVVGVPRGGYRLEKALNKYSSYDYKTLLIVDDVLTTGKSLQEEYIKWSSQFADISTAVIFNRNKLGFPVTYSIFNLGL